jgi:DNA-binding NarL/FixJ family response regulator
MPASDITNINLKVLIMDTDFYAMQAVNSYLAWDRRTRVTAMTESPEQMWRFIDHTPLAELPDVIVLDSDHWLPDPAGLSDTITHLRERIDDVLVLCLGRVPDAMLVEAAANAGARGYFLKQDVRLQIAWAIVYSLHHDFVMTSTVARACEGVFHPRIFRARRLPEQRDYPELTDRIRQAIRLCVVEGMPAHLAADEMGISLHTIRGYIKEGYRIMEAYDENEYPVDMTPQERAFMRFTAFADEHDETGNGQPESDAE